MGLKHQTSKTSPSILTIKSIAYLIFVLIATYFLLLLVPLIGSFQEPFSRTQQAKFHGDLLDAQFPWNKLCFGPAFVKLKLAVFSKTWPMGAAPGGMERHASTLYNALAAKGHEIHVFTVPSDRQHHLDIQNGDLHVHFVANEHGSVNCSLAFEIFNQENMAGAFDYVHTESVSLPHWRAKTVPKVAVTWHGIWYEIMHSKLFQELLSEPQELHPGSYTELHNSMPRLVDEIRFFPSYTQHICISNSAKEALVNVYQLPRRNVHVILNGVDDKMFVHDPVAGAQFRKQNGIPANVSMVIGVTGRLVRDKGHPLLYEAFSSVSKHHPGVILLVSGSGPWEKHYTDFGPRVKVLGELDPSQLSEFYNALDVFVNPTLRPQGLDLTLMEAMQCGKPVLATNFPSITGTVVVNEDFGYTFSPNVGSLIEALESVIRDGPIILHSKGMICRAYALSLFTATKMAAAYERFFLCMKNNKYCQYPLPTDC